MVMTPSETKELWKSQSLCWKGLFNGSEYSVAKDPLFCTNCNGMLGSEGECRVCHQKHKIPKDINEACAQASAEYQASKIREEYQVVSRPIGAKQAEQDINLPNNRYMNVVLENRKGKDQIVITIGDKGVRKHAQIFVDLSKNEIRHDAGDQDPALFMDSVVLKNETGGASKTFRSNDSSRGYAPSENEEKILRAIHKKDSSSRSTKHTDREVWHFVRAEHPEINERSFEEGFEILLSQGFFKKETVSTKLPQFSFSTTRKSMTTVKTTYYILSGKALLYLTGRGES